MTATTLFVVVPLFNEVDNVARLIESLDEVVKEFGRSFHVEFVLVDDGSRDGTASVAERLASGLQLVVLTHPVNRGPGHAFGTAFEYLAPRVRPDDWIVTMEGDNTSRHELLRQMITRTQEGYDVVLASVYMYGGGILHTSPYRMFLSHVANTFVKEFLGIHGILTMSSFYRLYRGHVLRQLQDCYGARVVESAGFESAVEVLMKLVYLGVRISEVPMVLDSSRRVGPSKMRVARTMRGYLGLFRHRRRWQMAATEHRHA